MSRSHKEWNEWEVGKIYWESGSNNDELKNRPVLILKVYPNGYGLVAQITSIDTDEKYNKRVKLDSNGNLVKGQVVISSNTVSMLQHLSLLRLNEQSVIKLCYLKYYLGTIVTRASKNTIRSELEKLSPSDIRRRFFKIQNGRLVETIRLPVSEVVEEVNIDKYIKSEETNKTDVKDGTNESLEEEKPSIKSNGIYSVLYDEWIKKPEKTDIPEIDKEEFDKLFKEWEDRYNELLNKVNKKESEEKESDTDIVFLDDSESIVEDIDEDEEDMIDDNHEITEVDNKFAEEVYNLFNELINVDGDINIKEDFSSEDSLNRHFKSHCLGEGKDKVSRRNSIYYDFKNEGEYNTYEKKFKPIYLNEKTPTIETLYDKDKVEKLFRKFFEGSQSLILSTGCGFKSDNGRIILVLTCFENDVTKNYEDENTISLCVLNTSLQTITLYPISASYLETKLNNIIKRYNEDKEKEIKFKRESLQLGEDMTDKELFSMTPYMLRNDGKLISCGEFHPYIKLSNSEPYENNLKYIKSNLDNLDWFYNNTLNNETKELIEKVKKGDYSRETLDKLNDLTNQEFCRVRTSNYKYKYGGDNGKVYFRISSKDFNWFDLIWEVVNRFKDKVSKVSIMKDKQTFGKDFDYYKVKGQEINHMDTNDFLTLEGNPIIESLNEELLDESAKTDFIDKFGQEIFNNFEKAKQRLKNNNMSVDYGQYLKYEPKELQDLILSLYDDKKDSQRKRIIQGTDKEIRGKYNYLGEKDGYKVYQPLDYLSSMDLGVNTGWCTTGRYGHYGHPEYTPSESDAKKHWEGYTSNGIKFFYFVDSKTMYGKYALALYPKVFNVNKVIEYNLLEETNFELYNDEDSVDYKDFNNIPHELIPNELILKYENLLEGRIIKEVKINDKICKIQCIDKEQNLWDFLDLPIKSKVYDTWDIAKKYNSNHDGKNNNLDKLIPQIKQELEKNDLKIGKIWIPSKEEYEGGISFYSKQKNRIKYWEGKPYWYWTSTPFPGNYGDWYSVYDDGHLDWNFVDYTGGVSFPFEILE